MTSSEDKLFNLGRREVLFQHNMQPVLDATLGRQAGKVLVLGRPQLM